MTEAYALAAEQARDVGADAIEIHAGHGFLLSAFLSPRSNRRDDQYGGSAQNRARFLVEVLAAIRARLGADFPLWCKIDAAERLVPDGITPADARITAELLKAAGADAVTLSLNADMSQAIGLTESNIPHAPAGMMAEVAQVGRGLGLPVIAAGRLEPEHASGLIADGVLDFAAFGRKLLADPEFAGKLAAGRLAEVRPCMYCYACISQLSFDRPVKCAANPDTGHETARAIRPASAPMRVVVVGGGPAGIEAARRLALSGHRVTLFEAAPRLGGTMRHAALAYPPNEALLDWLIAGLHRSGAEVRLGQGAAAATIAALQPDLCVVATGALRPRSNLPGADQPRVLSGQDFQDLLAGTGRGATGLLLRLTSALNSPLIFSAKALP